MRKRRCAAVSSSSGCPRALPIATPPPRRRAPIPRPHPPVGRAQQDEEGDHRRAGGQARRGTPPRRGQTMTSTF
jgi:hypothetical protein